MAVAKATGAAIKNPQRHLERSAPKGVAELGDPPAWMLGGETDGAARAWEGFKRELPWLRESHRGIVEIAAVLRGHFIDGAGSIGLQAMQEYRRCLSVLGATPADESKVNMGHGDDEDPEEALFAAAKPEARKPESPKPRKTAANPPSKPH